VKGLYHLNLNMNLVRSFSWQYRTNLYKATYIPQHGLVVAETTSALVTEVIVSVLAQTKKLSRDFFH